MRRQGHVDSPRCTTPPVEIIRAFAGGSVRTVEAVASGRIHDSWKLIRAHDEPLLVQRLNTFVFPDVDLVVANARNTVEALRQLGVPTLELVAASDGSLVARDSRGEPWRALGWVEGAVARVDEPAEVRALAEAFGRFAAGLRAVPAALLPPTIMSLHDIDARVRRLSEVAAADPVGCVASCRVEIDRCHRLVERLGSLPERVAWATLPQRIAHHDAKPSNALRRRDGELCVVDLDTTMTGTVIADIGQLVRTCAVSADGSSAPAFDNERLRCVIEGWLGGWAGSLDEAEHAAIPTAGIVVTIENAVRSLIDHLEGDRYFRVAHRGDNLVRARAGIAHARIHLDAYDDVRRVVETSVRGPR